MSDTKEKATAIGDEADMIANLDLLINFDIAQSEKDWSLFSNGSDASNAKGESMPDDLMNEMPGDSPDGDDGIRQGDQ